MQKYFNNDRVNSDLCIRPTCLQWLGGNPEVWLSVEYFLITIILWSTLLASQLLIFEHCFYLIGILDII